ncbi:putative galacturonosyltransferase 7 [Platanthera guangdongensis]|uniref:Galacturonosyltransferase 7 n=1 Tax=Platanthera guangdongensis TaxID=2320717 RepID=A0ABR2MHG7_9ASPA
MAGADGGGYFPRLLLLARPHRLPPRFSQPQPLSLGSMILCLIFAGFLADDRFPLETSFGNSGRVDSVQESFEGAHSRIDKVIKKFGVSPIKENTEKEVMWPADLTVNTKTNTIDQGKSVYNSQKNDSTSQFHMKNIFSPNKSQFHPKSTLSPSKPMVSNSNFKAIPTLQIIRAKLPPSINRNKTGGEIRNIHIELQVVDGTKTLCQLEFGSYCLWSEKHKITMKDFMVKRLKDQLFLARAYYPSIAKLKAQTRLSHELKQSIQDHEKILSEGISDTDLPPFVRKKMQKMDEAIVKAKQCSIDCTNVDRKLRQILDLTEDEVHFHMKQSAFLYNLGVQTMPKSLHCFFMRLTVEYLRSSSTGTDIHTQKHWNPSFKHYVVFSVNVLAASVTVNSTVMNSEVTGNIVFHVITDKQNYYAMKYWFMSYSFKEVSIHVINIDELEKSGLHNLVPSHLSRSEEFRISMRNMNHSSNSQMKTEHISVFGHSHFLLPEIFKNLKKVVILDDDLVVQQDLSSLWDLDMEGKVVGAVQFCRVTLGHLKAYLARNKYDPDSCVWMSGLNVVDLEKWREHNVTGLYIKLLHKLVIFYFVKSVFVMFLLCKGDICNIISKYRHSVAQTSSHNKGPWKDPTTRVEDGRRLNINCRSKHGIRRMMKSTDEVSLRTVMLPTSLLAFQNLVHPLHSSWTLSGLGYDYRISDADTNDAVTLHYNGNMKPWLELGIPRYKRLWSKFLKKGDRFMSDCNVNLPSFVKSPTDITLSSHIRVLPIVFDFDVHQLEAYHN